MDWLDLLAVQGTLKSLLQQHNSEASILWHSVFFMVQLSHPYMTTVKKHSLDQTDLCWQSNVSVFNILSSLVITFLPRSKHILISWLQSPSAVIFGEKKKKKVCHCFPCSPSICKGMEPDAMILVF